jgi:alkanesulfonate monooxygenase SsuD/methylene tetrahydromethanopterin reductase-like flavin-dependent oxidoreductase (luciferase family)
VTEAGPPGHQVDPVQRYVDDVVIWGTPEEVTDQIAELREGISLDYLMCAPLSHSTFEMFTERVMPKLI